VGRPVAVVNEMGVSVGSAVGLSVAVGGTGVFVGTDASVCATLVDAAASAVCPISTGLTVGADAGAQAPRSKVNMTAIVVTLLFIYFLLKLVDYNFVLVENNG
jgi:hypothetical protein